MLKINFCEKQLSTIALAVILPALLSSCSFSRVNEETFFIYIGTKPYHELVKSLQDYAIKHGYRITLETLQGDRAETTAQHIMVEGDGVRTLVQSSLAEQCEEREGMRDVEYSLRLFDANAFSTSYFISHEHLSWRVKDLKDTLTHAGFRILSKSESCSFL